MEIRFAENHDIDGIIKLLGQVGAIHHDKRPDLFKSGTKYDKDQLADILKDESRPILVAVESGFVLGYAFSVIKQNPENGILTNIKTLYLDDLCVDEKRRGEHIGKKLYLEVLKMAKRLGCYNVTLNAWCLNPDAISFYEAVGMTPLKICMEQVVDGFDFSKKG